MRQCADTPLFVSSERKIRRRGNNAAAYRQKRALNAYSCYNTDMAQKVVVGMSGGVDSSLAAALLKEQGYDVIGLFMRNWHETDDGGNCTADEDFYDVRRVCDKLGIPYFSVDFADEYYDRVFRQFLDEYAKGRTPNPDVLCNREIKFEPFVAQARKMGADLIATGHYCRIRRDGGKNRLLRAADENKDQTYFLNQVRGEQLDGVIFPIGDMLKPQVRELAEKFGLSTARKKDSTGICFIGERNFREFLSRYLPMKKGEIRSDKGELLGEHDGVFYYTLGQRRGLGIGGVDGADDGRWFVVGKDVTGNVLYVSQSESALYRSALECDAFNFISGEPDADEFDCMARIRHRQPLQKARAKRIGDGVRLEFERPQRAIAAGQYAVIYDGEECLGGGQIERADDSGNR